MKDRLSRESRGELLPKLLLYERLDLHPPAVARFGHVHAP